MKKNNKDLAGQEFWDDAWDSRILPPAVAPERTELDFHVDQQFHRYFQTVFKGRAGGRLLEVGCAGSRWLPYFAKHYGFEVQGLDYSPNGCAQARKILKRDGVHGTIHQGDMFNPPPELLGQFDAVVSFGLVEHFQDTTITMKSLAAFLKPSGTIVTMVPNVSYLPGTLMRLINREVYDLHVPLTPQTLESAATLSGLTTINNGYFMTLNLSALSLAVVKREKTWWTSPLLRGFSALSKICWLMNRGGIPETPNRLTSPFIMHTARKP